MPFGMSPVGWFMWPHFAQWLGYSYPYSSPYAAPYSYAPTPYTIPYSYTPVTKEQEITYLQDQAKTLKREYERINTQLKELQKTK